MDTISEEIKQHSPRSILLASVTFLFVLQLCRWMKQSIHCPPGPFPWPVIGNAAQLGNAPHIYFTRMAKKYGNLFQIKLGCRKVVVLNGELIRQALVKNGTVFAGRPDFTSFKYISGGSSLAFGTSTEWWKVHRKAAHSTVRMFSIGNMKTKKAFENHLVCEFRELLQLFLKKTQEHKYFQPMTYLVVSTANVISAVCFGQRYSYEDAEFRQVVGRNDQFTQTVGAGSIVDVMPWLQYFPNPIKTMFDNFKRLNVEFSAFIGEKVRQHRKTFQSHTIRDMTDALIMAVDQIQEKTGGQSSSRDSVVSAISDIFGASQDTISTALQWIILILVRFPHIQQHLQQEVGKVVDRSRLPTLEDQHQLSYVMAFIYEVMRYTSFVPLTIPHCTTMDTSITGYFIPKDTVVFINQWSINHDPNVWDHPDEFDPQRFLYKDGSLNKDMTSTVLIFSLGKRRCIGEDLSKMQLFLFTSLLAHQCHIKSDPARPVTLLSHYGLTLKPHPFYITLSMRDDLNLLDKVERKSVFGETQQGGGSPDQTDPLSAENITKDKDS